MGSRGTQTCHRDLTRNSSRTCSTERKVPNFDPRNPTAVWKFLARERMATVAIFGASGNIGYELIKSICDVPFCPVKSLISSPICTSFHLSISSLSSHISSVHHSPLSTDTHSSPVSHPSPIQVLTLAPPHAGDKGIPSGTTSVKAVTRDPDGLRKRIEAKGQKLPDRYVCVYIYLDVCVNIHMYVCMYVCVKP